MTQLEETLNFAAKTLGGTFFKNGDTGFGVNFVNDDDMVELIYDKEGDLAEIFFDNHEFSNYK